MRGSRPATCSAVGSCWKSHWTKARSVPILPPQGASTKRTMKSACGTPSRRSEEHTSELQSLMRISYAVFCLKKKRQKKHNDKTQDGILIRITIERRHHH